MSGDTSEYIFFCTIVTFGTLLMFPYSKQNINKDGENPKNEIQTKTNELYHISNEQHNRRRGKNPKSSNF